MGIPRLSRDLQPYSESVILGDGQVEEIELRVCKVVIDGPSFVHHVYGQLSKYLSTDEAPSIPSYGLINSAILHLLTGLTRHGVSVVQILFDGSLPVSKRNTRLDRLEKTRQQLERYRRTDASIPQSTSSIDQLDLESALWDSSTLLRSRETFPTPPFIVAAAIECLLQSSWGTVTSVVDGEADGFCAATARSENAAVLSNDSDLFLFDLGEHGSVIQFHSLQLTTDMSVPPPAAMIARCFRPKEIARKLNTPDFLVLGFERYKDSTISLSNIIQRAKEPPSRVVKDKKAWNSFRKQFQTTQFSASVTISEPNAILDPRTAELVSSHRQRSSELHSYLPILIEDPTRDSSWVYGRQIRQLAYSLLTCCRTQSQIYNPGFVVEHSRSGHRISSENIMILSPFKMRRLLDAFQHDYSATLETNPPNAHNQVGSFLAYLTVAIQIIIFVKSAAGKDFTHEALKRIFINPRPNEKYDWNDLHLNANVQAVIYSIRMLKQLAQYAQSRLDNSDADLKDHLDKLCETLQDMPPLQDVMLDPRDTFAYMCKISTEERRSIYRKLLSTAQEEKLQHEAKIQQKAAALEPVSVEQRSDEQPASWSTVQGRHISRKTSLETQSNKKRELAASSAPVAKTTKTKSRNRFDLLQDLG